MNEPVFEQLWTDAQIDNAVKDAAARLHTKLIRDDYESLLSQFRSYIAKCEAERLVPLTDDEIDTTAGCTVYNYSAVYLDADVTPYEAATMILATLGPVYVNNLIDALIDTFEIKPQQEEQS